MQRTRRTASARRHRVQVSSCTCDALRAAIGEGELDVYFQPVVDLHHDLVVGLEALVRWHHPSRGLLAAGAFVPDAEACGVVGALDAWVLDRAVAQIARWQEDVLIAPGFRVAVNMSGVEFGNSTLVADVADALARHGADPECLTIELTETAALADMTAAHRSVRSLQQLGARVALDDFGTAYATFQRLRCLPFDEVKLDREITVAAGSPVGSAFVRAIVDLGEELGLRIVAEGIETPDQAAVAASLGCTVAQGYLWSPPLPAADVTAVLQSGTMLSRR
jgi:EAL domain-containing protein (putative c-di-GMP-specific phosphodiesterase class I)